MTTAIVAMDGREFLPDRETGIGRYLHTLVDRVRRHPPAWSLRVVGPPGYRAPDGVSCYTIGDRDGWAWDLLHVPRFLRQVGARAYVTPYVKFRPTAGCAVVAVVCDPTDLLPEVGTRGPLARVLMRSLRRRLAYRAAVRITISFWSRNEIARILNLPAAGFRVIPPGVSLPAHPMRAPGGTGYVLHLSNGKPHKNIPRLLEAYAALPPPLQTAHPLVLAGIHSDHRETVERTLKRHSVIGTVRLEGHVDESALPMLYSGAVVFAFPSLVEGFGIPPLEAMAFGVPVVASTGGALPEALGDAAILVDPQDTRGLREALAAVLTNGELRDRLICRGRARAGDFPAERTGEALVEVVDEVITHGLRP